MKQVTGPKPKSLPERFAARVRVSPTGCWEWPGSPVKGDYRQMWTGSRVDGSRRRQLAHVVSYETFIGAIPAGLELDHLCLNTSCCNPAHLEAVTHAENMRRRVVSVGVAS